MLGTLQNIHKKFNDDTAVYSSAIWCAVVKIRDNFVVAQQTWRDNYKHFQVKIRRIKENSEKEI